MIAIEGFAPDLDPVTPGVLTDCASLVPTERGFASANTLASVGAPALGSAATGGAVVTKVDGSQRIFAGHDTQLFELTGGSWINRSRTGNYSSARWRFDQLGDVTIAANGTSVLQASTTAAFADITGSPIAKFVVVSNGFAMAFCGSAIGLDGWACSALYDYTNWTPSAATQAATARLIDTPGPIVGAKALGDLVVVYKERSMWLGQYVGPPVIWSWSPVAGNSIGALSHESIVDVGFAHLFVGKDDFYMFDGTRPVPIGAPVRRWFAANADPTYHSRTVGVFDRYNNRVRWHFAGLGSGGALNRCLVYNVKTQKWGRDDQTIQAAMQYVNPGLTWGQLWTSIGLDWRNWPAIEYGAVFPSQGSPVPAVFDSSGVLSILAGAPAAASMTTGDFGDDGQVTLLRSMFLRFLRTPTAVTAQGYSKMVEGDTPIVDAAGYYHDGRIDLLQSARWHRMQVGFTGAMEIVGFDPKLQPDGSR